MAGRESGLHLRPDSFGRFGKYGGKYVPETLMYALTELDSAFHSLAKATEFQAVCTEAGMFALRERIVHVTQEYFEMSVARVMKKERIFHKTGEK